MSTRPNFKPLDLTEATDEQLEAFAARKNVPTLLRAVPAKAAPAADIEDKPLRRVTLNVPDYILHQLKTRAFEGRCTVRHIIMTALKADGIQIEDADMAEDARRLR